MPSTVDSARRKADSDESIATILKEGKLGKFSEGNIKGLFLLVSSTRQVWRLKFVLDGTEGTLTIGDYPGVSIVEARKVATNARVDVAAGINPSKAKKANKAALQEQRRTKEANTLRKVAEDWLAFNSTLAPKTLSGHKGVLKNHLYPVAGDVPVADLSVGHVKTVLERLATSPTMARYSLRLLRMILDYAMDHELIDKNVAVGRKGLLKKHKTVHRAALETPDDLAEFLRRLNNFVAFNDCVVSALWIMVLIPARPAEIATMKWADLDLGETKPEWRYTVPKTGKPHVVPLSTQAAGQLRLIREHSLNLANRGTVAAATPFGKTAASEAVETPTWVFPSSGKFGVPIAADTLLVRIRTGLGYERGTITSHGFRATFRTLGHEVLGIDPLILELCVGHGMPGALGATYARAQLLGERRIAMQKWADYVEELWGSVAGY